MKDNHSQAKKEEGTLSVPASGDTKPGGQLIAQDDTKLQLERSASLPADNQPDKIHKKSPKERFLEKWNSQDECCKTCNQITKINRGLTKQNMKRLVWGPPTIQDWLTLIMLIGVLMMAYRYHIETATCQETLNNIDSICMKYCISNTAAADLNKNISNQFTFDPLVLSKLNSAAQEK